MSVNLYTHWAQLACLPNLSQDTEQRFYCANSVTLVSAAGYCLWPEVYKVVQRSHWLHTVSLLDTCSAPGRVYLPSHMYRFTRGVLNASVPQLTTVLACWVLGGHHTCHSKKPHRTTDNNLLAAGCTWEHDCACLVLLQLS